MPKRILVILLSKREQSQVIGAVFPSIVLRGLEPPASLVGIRDAAYAIGEHAPKFELRIGILRFRSQSSPIKGLRFFASLDQQLGQLLGRLYGAAVSGMA
ncbi:hypothetical protein GCM10009090_04920 [[Pseudomonas] boreopolis]|uniref:Uncharacterized protein n=1 Tax=Xanthomonas boreopolis TaxID=86183 RepID=A0A919F552_9XANT|nr:hypothetical protein GCM10009090_04920 [[Pseudomonas] boreopolis]